MRNRTFITIILVIIIIPLGNYLYLWSQGSLLIEGRIKGSQSTEYKDARLNELLAKAIPSKGKWSVYIQDLDSQQEIIFNEHQRMEGASTLKLLTARTLQELISEGKFDLTKDVEGPVSDHLHLMVNLSDNNSWNTLNSLVTFDKMAQTSYLLNMKDTNIFDNTTSAHDIGLLLRDIYLTSKTDGTAKFILNNMKNTETEGRIPAAFPGVTVYHKSGTYDAHIHDAGIVAMDHPFILVIFSEGLSKEQAEPLMRELAQNIQKIISSSDFGRGTIFN